MRVCAALAWYDEPDSFLDRCVRSLVGVADHLVALDGPWHGFPGLPYSGAGNYDAIRSAASAIGVPLAFGNLVQQLRGVASWESQVVKRSTLMAICDDLSADWIFVIDGDEFVHEASTDATRAALEAADTDVGTVVCQHITGQQADRFSAPIRRFYRAGTRIETAHNGYRRAGRWLHGDPSYVKLERAFATPLVLHHERSSRSEGRNQAAMVYRAHRRAQRTEAWTSARSSATEGRAN
jgi:hypothetical protein